MKQLTSVIEKEQNKPLQSRDGMQPLYSIVTKHTEDSIRKLSSVQYNTFSKKAKFGYYLVCFALVFMGIMMGGTGGFACLIFACFMVTGAQLPAKRNADKVIKSMKGKYPETEYDFFETELRFGLPGETYKDMGIVEYTRFERFIEDRDYLFLFVTQYGAYVIPKSKLTQDELDKLKQLICKASGKEFEKPGSMLNLKLRELFEKR